MSKTAFDGSGRGTIFFIDPRRPQLVGLDTPHKSEAEHPLWQKIGPPNPNLTQNILAVGNLVAVELCRNGVHEDDNPGKVWDPKANDKLGAWVDGYIWRKGDALYEVADGRNRTVNCRAGFLSRLELGGVPPLLKVEIIHGGEDRAVEVMIAGNEFRRQPSPLERARQATSLLNQGQPAAYVCTLYGVDLATLAVWQRIVNLAKPVQKAVEEGKIAATSAVKLDKFSRDKQVEKLKELVDKAGGKRVTGRELERAMNGKGAGPAPIRLTKGRAKKLLEDTEWAAERSPDAQALLRFLAGDEDALEAIPGLAERIR